MTTKPKPSYRVRNWREYDAALKQRGSLTFWIDEGAIHGVFDSTAVKVYGEGEWKVRQHGVDKQRTWRKLHVGVNEATGEILAAVASTNNVSDDEAFADILDGVDEEIEQVSGDGAYDQRKCYDEIAAHGATPTIPPRKDATRWQDEPETGNVHPRNQVLEQIEAVGRQQWKQQSGYQCRSLAEMTLFRFKTIFGATLRRRRFDNQAVELFLKCAALHRIIQLGKPDSYKVEN